LSFEIEDQGFQALGAVVNGQQEVFAVHLGMPNPAKPELMIDDWRLTILGCRFALSFLCSVFL
jgi:hypothetical protein